MSLKLAVALGGGGVRGLANIGVLKAFDEVGIKPDIVTGTSMGAIVGSVYADSVDAFATERIIKGYMESEDFIDQASKLRQSMNDEDRRFIDKAFEKARQSYFYYRFLVRRSLVSPEAFFMGMDNIIPAKKFDELPLPFACMGLNISRGREEILHQGDLRPAVKASSSVPGVLPPVEINGEMYVDGGWVETVPVSAARFLGADFVMAVDVSRRITPVDYENDLHNSMDILTRSDEIARAMLNSLRTERADFVVRPNVANVEWSNFDNLDDHIQAGYEAGLNVAEALQRRLRWRSAKRWLWPLNR